MYSVEPQYFWAFKQKVRLNRKNLFFPKHVGGLVMVCPCCGKRFSSDFKLGRVGKKKHCGVTSTIFELPTILIEPLQLYFRRK